MPYPQAPTKKDNNKWQGSRFIYILKKLQISTPFYESLEQLPIYLNFLRENRKKEIRYIKKP